jgi:hypothetical protein
MLDDDELKTYLRLQEEMFIQRYYLLKKFENHRRTRQGGTGESGCRGYRKVSGQYTSRN